MEKVKKNYYKEVLFYFFLGASTLLKWLDVHFVSKNLAAYLLITFGVVTIVFLKHISKIKKSSRQTKFLILLPILFVITQSLFVLFIIFWMAFVVFRFYERTKFNKIMKALYSVLMVLCIFVLAYSVAFYNELNQSYDEYEGYVFSPDQSKILTYKAKELVNNSSRLTYYIEDVHFDIFRKEVKEITSGFYYTKNDIQWESNEQVRIGHDVYNIVDGSIVE